MNLICCCYYTLSGLKIKDNAFNLNIMSHDFLNLSRLKNWVYDKILHEKLSLNPKFH